MTETQPNICQKHNLQRVYTENVKYSLHLLQLHAEKSQSTVTLPKQICLRKLQFPHRQLTSRKEV